MEDAAENKKAGQVCVECGNPADSGRIFCSNCGGTLRPPVPLVPTARAANREPTWKRILRGVVKTVAAAAGLVFFFDNRSSGKAGIVLVASLAVLFLCMIVWLILGLGDDHGFWPKKSDL